MPARNLYCLPEGSHDFWGPRFAKVRKTPQRGHAERRRATQIHQTLHVPTMTLDTALGTRDRCKHACTRDTQWQTKHQTLDLPDEQPCEHKARCRPTRNVTHTTMCRRWETRARQKTCIVNLPCSTPRRHTIGHHRQNQTSREVQWFGNIHPFHDHHRNMLSQDIPRIANK